MISTNIGFHQDVNIQHVSAQHATSFTESDGVVVYPSVGVATHGVASCDSAGEGGEVSNHNPCGSCCDLDLWWNCIGTSDTTQCS